MGEVEACCGDAWGAIVVKEEAHCNVAVKSEGRKRRGANQKKKRTAKRRQEFVQKAS